MYAIQECVVMLAIHEGVVWIHDDFPCLRAAVVTPEHNGQSQRFRMSSASQAQKQRPALLWIQKKSYSLGGHNAVDTTEKIVTCYSWTAGMSYGCAFSCHPPSKNFTAVCAR